MEQCTCVAGMVCYPLLAC